MRETADAQIEALTRVYEGDVPDASLLVLHEGEAVVRRALSSATPWCVSPSAA